MIIKTLTRRSNPGQLIRYVHKEILNYVTADRTPEHDKTESKPLLIRHNVRGHSLEEYVSEFNVNESYRIHKRSNQTVLQHTILSWAESDTKYLTDPVLYDMTKQFIKLRAENCLVVGSVHRDCKSHVHVHLVVSGTEINGKASRISKQRLSEIKISMDEYQKTRYPELVSLPEHGKKREGILEKSYKVEGTLSKKQNLAIQIEKLKTQAKSLDEFYALLQSRGYQPYFRGAANDLTGIVFEDKKYRFKTLGFDEKTFEAQFEKNLSVDMDLVKMQQLRNRSKEQVLAKENPVRGRAPFPSREIFQNDTELERALEGDGDTPRNSAFYPEQVSFNR